MCGRYTLRTSSAEVARQFGLFDVPDLPPRYNIAPTQTVAVVRGNAPRELALLRWGLVPSWAASPPAGAPLINARAETAATKPSFRSAFKSRRCLIVADGFYEWRKLGNARQPYYIHRRDDGLLALAGLWECRTQAGESLESCAIITTAANATMQPLHDRMPVIIARDNFDTWLTDAAHAGDLLRPCPAEDLEAYPVRRQVGNPRYDRPDCIEPDPGATTTER